MSTLAYTLARFTVEDGRLNKDPKTKRPSPHRDALVCDLIVVAQAQRGS